MEAGVCNKNEQKVLENGRRGFYFWKKGITLWGEKREKK
jgi:hypothetical protein